VNFKQKNVYLLVTLKFDLLNIVVNIL